MKKFKKKLKKILGDKNYNRLTSLKFKITSTFYLEIEKIKVLLKKLKCYKDKKYIDSVDNAIRSINQNTDSNYIIFHNPKFLGVTNATKELFDNLVPLGDLYRKKDVYKIYDAIIATNIKEVYFSAFCYNWKTLVIKLKKHNPSLIIKTFWHGSHSQILDTYGWCRNQEIIKLHQNGFIDQMGSCKASLIDFYEKNGYNSIFLNNTVSFNGKDYISSVKNKKLKIGVYSANTEWRKNMMTQVSVVKLLDNAVIDMVPINPEAARFASSLGVTIEGLEKPIPREELLHRMAENDINLYVTFSECAPMLPLESLEVGVPCIAGNNHHFFKNSPLEKYLIVNNETDIFEIKEKIELCLKNKDKILKLYDSWKKENDLITEKQVKSFMNGGK